MHPDGLWLAFRKVSRPLLGFALSPAIVLSSFLTDGTVRFAFLVRRLRFSGRICSHVTTSTLTTFLTPQPLWHHTCPDPKPWDRWPVLSACRSPSPCPGPRPSVFRPQCCSLRDQQPPARRPGLDSGSHLLALGLPGMVLCSLFWKRFFPWPLGHHVLLVFFLTQPPLFPDLPKV